MIKKFFKIVLSVVLIIILILAAVVLSFRFGRNADKKSQAERIEALRAEFPKRFEIPDSLLSDDLRLNEIRWLATHNSYHGQAGLLQLAVLDLVEPGEADKLRYSHQDLYTQLALGVRSFEFDLRYYRSSSIENIHVPLVDNRGPSPVFELALEEMKLWSDRHPQHIPLIIIMETKDDWSFLDPGIKKWSAAALLETDRLIASVLGDRLISPPMAKSGWPLLGDSRGRLIFVFHESEAAYFSDEYLDSPERISFFMTDTDSSEASFVLRNEPDTEEIRGLVRDGFIIRTRADADLQFSDEHRNRAVASGAQIVSTDFPLGYASNPPDYSLGWQELLRRYIY